MSTVANSNRFSYAEYLERENAAPTKSEFYAGEIFAMAGGSRRHNSITGNFFAHLYAKLSSAPCRPFMSDQRIRISTLNLGTYPDVSVVCGEPEGDKADPEAITNPRVLVEVLSQSTESYDRGRKFSYYRRIESLEEYVLVSQDEPLVERFKRQPGGDWMLRVFEGVEAILNLESIQVVLPLKDIYRQIDWNADDMAEPQLNTGTT